MGSTRVRERTVRPQFSFQASRVLFQINKSYLLSQKYDQQLVVETEGKRMGQVRRKAAAEADTIDPKKRRKWDLDDLTNAKRRETRKPPLQNTRPLGPSSRTENYIKNRPLSSLEVRKRKPKTVLMKKSIGAHMFPDGAVSIPLYVFHQLHFSYVSV